MYALLSGETSGCRALRQTLTGLPAHNEKQRYRQHRSNGSSQETCGRSSDYRPATRLYDYHFGFSGPAGAATFQRADRGDARTVSAEAHREGRTVPMLIVADLNLICMRNQFRTQR